MEPIADKVENFTADSMDMENSTTQRSSKSNVEGDTAILESFIPAYYKTEVNYYIHVPIMVAIWMAGLVSSCLVLAVYNKRQTDMLRLHIVGLAILDVIAINLLLPATPFYQLMTGDVVIIFFVYYVGITFIMTLYLEVLTSLAVERFVAVTWPFTFRRMLKPIRIIFVVFAVTYLLNSITIVIAAYLNLPALHAATFGYSSINGVLMISAIIVSYGVIICKIYTNQKNMKKYKATDITKNNTKSKNAEFRQRPLELR